jgi:hypothetical protein
MLIDGLRLYFDSQPDATKNWGQRNTNLNDYDSDPIEVRSTCWISDLHDWWCQKEETFSNYADLSKVAGDISSIISHCVRVESRFSFGRDVIGWRESKTTGGTLHKNFIIGQFAKANTESLADVNPLSDTRNTKTTRKSKKKLTKGNCTEWPRSTTFW